MDKSTSQYSQRLAELEQMRADWQAMWQDIADYLLPRRGAFESRGDAVDKASGRYNKIIDGTATVAMRRLAAGMQGGMTSPARPWFRLSPVDGALREIKPVRLYLEECERRMYQALSTSNFYAAMHGLYLEMAGFGTSLMLVEPDERQLLRFRLITAGEYYLDENERGQVDTVYRKFKMAARNMVRRFGEDKLSESSRAIWKNAPHQRFEVIHACQPRDDRQAGRLDQKNKPIESVYFQEGEDALLSESGYDLCPFMCGRWGLAGADVYGRGPGHDVLGDVKMLQEIQKTSIKALHKVADPPMKAPDTLKGAINHLPAGVTRYAGLDGRSLEPLYQVKPPVEAIEQKVLRVQLAIKEALYNDLFIALIEPGHNMTATEVRQRHEEKLLLLGPTVERHQNEVLNPVIDWVFGFMAERGFLPQPPPVAEGQDLKVEFIGLLAQAQKAVGTQAIKGQALFAMELAKAYPQVLDAFDPDKALLEHGELIGSPASITRSAEEVAKMRQARAQAQEAAQKAEQMQQAAGQLGQVAGAAKELSETKMAGGNALAALLKAGGKA